MFKRRKVTAFLGETGPLAEIDIAKIVGPYGWGIMEHTAKTFPCPPCAEEGVRLVKFDRDFVELKIGKKPQDPQNFLRVLEEAQQLAEKRGIFTRAGIKRVLGPFAEVGGAKVRLEKMGSHVSGTIEGSTRQIAKAVETIGETLSNPGKRAGRPFGLTECEKRNPGVVARIERCSKKVGKDPSITSPIAVCRASIPCP